VDSVHDLERVGKDSTQPAAEGALVVSCPQGGSLEIFRAVLRLRIASTTGDSRVAFVRTKRRVVPHSIGNVVHDLS
jgi:hypothetical protein